MNLKTQQEQTNESKKEEGMEHYGGPTNAQVAELHAAVGARQLKQQARRQEHKQHHRNENRAPIRRHLSPLPLPPIPSNVCGEEYTNIIHIYGRRIRSEE